VIYWTNYPLMHLRPFARTAAIAAKIHKGKFSDSKRVWVDMVIERLDARLRERRLYTSISGRETDTRP
jgi:hypothetical protein